MGNQLAPPAKLQSDHVADLPNVVFKDTLGGPLRLRRPYPGAPRSFCRPGPAARRQRDGDEP
jgi:hypothetical protein